MAGAGRNALAVDFAEVRAVLIDRGILSATAANSLLNYAKIIHKYSYSLNIWRVRLEGLPDNGKLFLDELASDAIQVLPQSLEGYNKTAGLLMRGIIENTLKHIYYSDHPVEYRRLNGDRRWYMTMESLFEYARSHHDYVVTEPKFDALAQLSSLYSQLSEVIHARTVHHLELRSALSEIKSDEASMKNHALYISKCAQAANFLLAIFHRDQVGQIDVVERRILLRSMPPQARAVFTHFE